LNRTKINLKANKEISKQAEKIGICSCEICGSIFWLTRMHRHKRRWYYDKPEELLWHFKQWLIACITCHDYYERRSAETEEIFVKLRGEE
jgi:hypothetical protein